MMSWDPCSARYQRQYDLRAKGGVTVAIGQLLMAGLDEKYLDLDLEQY